MTSEYNLSSRLLNAEIQHRIEKKDIAGLAAMIDAGLDVNHTNAANCSLLYLAVLNNNNSKSISMLMEYGADPNYPKAVDQDKKNINSSPFRLACSSRNTDIVIAMLESTGPVKVDLLERDSNGVPASMLIASALSVREMEKAQSYFEENFLPKEVSKEKFQKSSLWLSTDDSGDNSFMKAFSVENKQWIIDQNFIDPKELVNLTNNDGETSLWLAVESFDSELVDFLISGGARVDIKDSTGMTMLEMAKKLNSEPIFSKLLAVDASRKAMAAINDVVGHHQAAKLTTQAQRADR